MRSPRQQLSVLPEHQSEQDSDEDEKSEVLEDSEHAVGRESEANENPPPQSIGTNPKHGGEGLPQPRADPPQNSHGWLETFIARRITVSRHMWNSLQSQKKKLSRALMHGENSQLAEQKGPRRSIFLMPLVSPFNPVCLLWMAMMLLFDLTYTASTGIDRFMQSIWCSNASFSFLFSEHLNIDESDMP